jgi:hypothetical protein
VSLIEMGRPDDAVEFATAACSVSGTAANTPAAVYITSASYALVVAPGVGIQLFGHALETKGAGAGTIRVRIADFAVPVNTPA